MKPFNQSINLALALALTLTGGGFASAQEATGEGATSIEEIVVTGRKREESLVDVPVSISVLTADEIAESGVVTQRDLFESVVGLNFDTATGAGDRNSAQPSIRGVQSNEIATTQQKVVSFIDGFPVLGQTASMSFSGVDQVEVYRGPQSAAFGRSTFAGAINYITSDAAEEFEARIQVRTSNLESNEAAISLSGPIGENLGYRISYIHDEFTGPDEWTATDGVKMGVEDTDTLRAKLNFELSDSVYGEIAYTRLEQRDSGAARWTLDPALCSGTSGNFLFNMGARIQLPAGAWDCDINTNGVERNHDVYGHFVANYDPAAFTAAYPSSFDANGNGTIELDEFLSRQFRTGVTYEQALRGQTVGVSQALTDRDRYQGELNFEIGDNLLSLLGMYSEEFYHRWNDSDATGSAPIFVGPMNSSPSPMTPAAAISLGMNVGTMSDPTTIEETYLEARWVSSEDRRLRTTYSASYYTYDFLTNVYFNYGAIAYGLTLPNGQPVNPLLNLIISNSTENYGVSFGLQYDLNESTTLSLEGRYQSDENCGSNVVNGVDVERCVTLESFAPRLAVNFNLSDTTSAYAQISQGTNPGGVVIAYANPLYRDSIEIAAGRMPVPAVGPEGTALDGVPLSNAGRVYDCSDGLHCPAVFYHADDWIEYDEEILTNYEIGAKGTFAGGRGSYAAALYYMDWEDLVLATNLNWNDNSAANAATGYAGGWNVDQWANAFDGNRTFLNAGDSEFYGLEATGSFDLNEVWTVSGNIALTRSNFVSYCSPAGPSYTTTGTPPFTTIRPVLTPAEDGVDASCSVVDGNDIPRSSRFKGSLSLSARLPDELFGLRTTLRADVRHTGKHYTDDFNLIERAAVTTMNLSANMRNENLSLRFFINNATDVDDPVSLGFANFYYPTTSPTVVPGQAAGWYVQPRRPREFGLTVGYEF